MTYRAPSAHRRRGFSLLEVVISVAILSIALLIASRLLLESQMRMAHSSRRALDPVGDVAVEQIRADVRAGAEVSPRDYEWTWMPLEILGHPAGTVRYEKVGSELVRRVEGDTLEGQRTLLTGVRVWRWRLRRDIPLPLVEIELGYQETARLGPLAAGGTREASAPVTRTQLISVSPRQAGGKRGW